MAQPTPYVRQYDLASVQSGNTLIPIPGSYLDQELNAVKNTLDQTLANLALIQRDDGALANGIVGVAALSSDVKALMATGAAIRGSWVTGTTYSVGNIVEQSTIAYMCLVDHVAGVFVTDLGNGRWAALTSSSLADGSVTTVKIADLNVTTAKLAADAVTFAKMQNITADRLLGRDTAGAGDPEEISVGGGLEFTGLGGVQRSALSGDVSATAGSNATTIGAGVVTYAKMQDVTQTARALGRNTAGAGDVEEVTVSQILDWIGSAAQGDLLYRGAAGWVRQPAGTLGQVLTTQGSGADPVWAFGSFVQSKAIAVGANQDHSAVIPWDNTIPQNTEGSEISAFSLAITPTSANNVLEVEVVVQAHSGAADSGDATIIALFQDSNAGALAAAWAGPGAANETGKTMVILHRMVAGTTSSTTFKVRIGRNSGGIVSVNGVAGSGKLGGVGRSTLVIREMAP